MATKQIGVAGRDALPQQVQGRTLAFTLLLAISAVAIIAAWLITPRLDWARYRQDIAAIAAAQLGRPVAIDGPIHLALLPRPELTAQGVTVADRGDGISARIGALRVTVAIGALLHGRLVALSLRLDDPVVSIPWPLPAANGNVPAIARGFSAQMDGGTLRLGGLELHATDADIHTDPDTGAFFAQGNTSLGADASVRFVAIAGAPGTGGVSALSLTLTGSQRFAGAAATFHGRRGPGGVIEGTFRADGPDASRILPAPADRWQIEGAVSYAFATDTIRAPSMSFMLGTSPGHADATWHLAAPARLDATAKLGQIRLGPWLQRDTSISTPFETRLNLSVAAAGLAGGTLREIHLAMLLSHGRTNVQDAQATLPGGAAAGFTGTMQDNTIAGALRLHMPRPRATLAWLHAAQFLPASVEIADLSTDITIAKHLVALAHIDATFNATTLHGDASWNSLGRQKLTAALSADDVDASDFPYTQPGVTDLLPMLERMDADFSLNVARLRLPGVALGSLQLHAIADRSGLTIPHLSADLPGAHLDAGGTLKPGGTVADAHFNLDANDAATLPAAWRPLPGLAQGPLHLALNAAGPPHAIAVQARCDLGDARAELDSTLDPSAQTLAGTATLRHPGAPRLLREAGIDGDAARWIGQGSVAIVTHFAVRPGFISATGISLAAASLRLDAHGSIDFTGPVPSVEATINAPVLTLPALDPRRAAPLPLSALAAWQGHIRVTAGEVQSDQWLVATNASADIAASGGVLAADAMSASVAGGVISGAAALDTASADFAAQGELTRVALTALAGPPWLWQAGTADLSFTLTATGHSPAAIVASAGGSAEGTMHDATIGGIDLPAVTRLLSGHAPKLRAALTAVLQTGRTGPLSGDISASMDDGALSISATDLSGDFGTVDYTAAIDLPARTEDAMIRLRPAVPAPPTLDARIVGNWLVPRRSVNVKDAVSWAGKAR